MAETEVHRDPMLDLIKTLERYYVNNLMICVSGNMMMYYADGNKRKHQSPDVFVTLSIPKQKPSHEINSLEPWPWPRVLD